MNTAEKHNISNTEQIRFESAVRGFNIRTYTAAPLRMMGHFSFNANASIVFAKLTDPNLIASWFGMVKGGEVDHSHSCQLNQWGEGSKRYCHTPMGTLDETIKYWQAPYITAYNVKARSMPVKDHCAVLVIKPTNESMSDVTWLQYFNYKGLVMRHFFSAMMIKSMNEGLQVLKKELGGEGGKMEIVKNGQINEFRINEYLF